MKRNFLWIFFLLIIVALTGWFSLNTILSLINYFELKESSPATIFSWEVTETKSDKYEILARFIFTYQGKVFNGQSFIGKKYLNPWAAENERENWSQKTYKVWFNPKYPERATLQKTFPVKSLISAGIMIAVLIYFLFFGHYIYKKI